MESPHLVTADRTAPQAAEVYIFADFKLDAARCELQRHGRPVAMTRKSLEVLIHLVRNNGRSVSRDELIAAQWPDTRVADGSLTQAIWEIRKALHQGRGTDRLIQTIRGLGYRFVGAAAPSTLGRPDPKPEAFLRRAAALRERVLMLPSETRSLVFELAELLARGGSLE